MIRRRWTTHVHHRFVSLMTALVIVSSATLVSFVKQAPAHADATHQAVIGMPFAGKWAFNTTVYPDANGNYSNSTSSHPSVHTKYYGDWATDIYANDGDGAAVTLQVTYPTSGVTFYWVPVTNGTCGQRTVIGIKVNGTDVGSVYFEHLNNAVTSGSITNGMTVGYEHQWTVSGSICNPGPHVHVELKNATTTPTTYACWADHGYPGVTLNQGVNLGVLGSTNTGAQQSCASIPSGGGTSWPGVGNAIYSGGDSMASGTTLLPGYYLTSANVMYALVFTVPDDNLVLYSNGNVLWQSGTSGQNANRAVMQTDGNLVMYRADNSVVFASGTGGHTGAYANLQNDGNFVVRDAGAAYWQSQSGGHTNYSYLGSDRLLASGACGNLSGQCLVQGQYFRSADNRYAVLFLTNGNVVLYGPGYHVLWQTGTTGHGDTFIMQPDGNVVLYALSTAWWWNGTAGSNYYGVIQTDGNFVVYDSGNVPHWSSGTNGQI